MSNSLKKNSEIRQIGPYLVVEELGQGGMGVVIRVRDARFDRTLAVKVLKDSLEATPELIRRFEEEAQIMGRLQHPGIPPVHDCGKTADGRPWFTMKLIKGRTLSALLKERHNPDKDLPQLLGIFEQVCQTLAYVHSEGIIHRDLKPSNIMVGAFGEVQVMDLGLSKRIVRVQDREKTEPEEITTLGSAPREEKEHENGAVSDGAQEESTAVLDEHSATPRPETIPGRVMGTLGYMAPEQARGEVHQLDERCDVFSLGAILCVILTGEPPFTGPRIRHETAKGDLSHAHARLAASGADADLVRLAKSCLSADPGKRPRDAGAVAEAVVTYQAQVQERLRQAELERAEARVQAAEEMKRRRVERTRNRLWLSLAAAAVLLVIGLAAGTVWYQAVATARAKSHAKREEGMVNAIKKARTIRQELHEKLREKGRIFELLNSPKEWARQLNTARLSLQSAKDLRQGAEFPILEELKNGIRDLEAGLQKDQADYELAFDLEKAREARAATVEGSFNNWAALRQYERVFEEAGFDVKPGHTKSLVKRIKNSLLRYQLVASLDDWAVTALLEEQNELGQRLFRVTRQVDPNPVRNQIRDVHLWQSQDRTKIMEVVAVLRRQLKEGNQLSPQIVDLVGYLLTPFEEDREVWLRQGVLNFPRDFWLNYTLGATLRMNKAPEAVGFCHTAVVVRPNSAAAWNMLGAALFRINDSEGAATTWNKAFVLDSNDPVVHNNLGILRYAKKDYDGAMAHFHAALRVDPNSAEAHINKGLVLRDKQDLDGAVAAFNKAIAAALASDSAYATPHRNLGQIQFSKKEYDGAIAEFRKAIAIDPDDAKTHNSLGLALHNNNNLDDAVDAFREAIKIHPNHSELHNNLGVALRDNHDLPGAITAYQKAIAIEPRNASAWANLGIAHYDIGKVPEAVAACNKAIALDKDSSAPAWNILGLTRHKQGDYDGAVTAYNKAIAIDENFAPAHYNLGNTWRAKQILEKAITAYEKAIRLKPDYAQAYCNLGFVHRDFGNFAQALKFIRQGHALGTKQSNWRYPSLRWIKESEQLVEFERKLDSVIRREVQPKDVNEHLTLAYICWRFLRRYRDAVKLYGSVFAAHPNIANDVRFQNRYNAACVAARALAGKGKDAGKITDISREQLRKRTLDWLRADLTAYDRELKAKPLAAFIIHEQMRRWQQDTDLSVVRDIKVLGKLSQAERKDWQDLWSDVDKLQKQASACYLEMSIKGIVTDRQTKQLHFLIMHGGRTYVIDMRSTQVDSLLRLEDTEDNKLQENNDIQPGKIRNSRIVFTPKHDGVYRLIATSFKQRGRGAYEIVIREFAPKRDKNANS